MSVGSALASVKPSICPTLFEGGGMPIHKVSTKGNIDPRVLSLSDDLFTLFISHHPVSKSKVQSPSDKLRYKSYKAFSKVKSSVTASSSRGGGSSSQVSLKLKQDIRVIDVADILFVQTGFIGSRKLEAACNNATATISINIIPETVITIFHNNIKTLDFIVEDTEDREAILHAIELIRVAYRRVSATTMREELLLRYVWNDTDRDKSGLIDQSEFLRLLARINVDIGGDGAIELFKYVTAEKIYTTTEEEEIGITFDECIKVFQKLKLDQSDGKLMSDVIFNTLVDQDSDYVTAENFLKNFLHQRQNELTLNIHDVRRIAGGEDVIDRVCFGEYLTSIENDIFDPQKQRFDPLTLTQPFSDYWINSSHNTYLTGHQLTSFSSVEAYAVALQRGCKCLEIDCWDGTNGYPIVYHGYTLTSKISFESIIICVKKYVDTNPTTLPIILSIENHCSLYFQKMMATILINTLEDKLYMHELTCPLDLIGKVAVKVKRYGEIDDEDFDHESTENDVLDQSTSSCNSSADNVSPTMIVAPELARLAAFHGVKFKSFITSIDHPAAATVHAFKEGKVASLLSKDPLNLERWKEYNKRHFSRIYPQNVDSSNYNPLVAWKIGCQFVALNYQTDDYAMSINAGRFRENGGCGYICKPVSTFTSDGGRCMLNSMQLKIKVLAGLCLPKVYGESTGSVTEPYVIVRLYDVHEINSSSSSVLTTELEASITNRQTRSIQNNGFCPAWNHPDHFIFHVISVDVAMVEFVVMDKHRGRIDDVLCKAAIPVSCLRQGFRNVQFYDACGSQHGTFGFASLLVEVDMKNPARGTES